MYNDKWVNFVSDKKLLLYISSNVEKKEEGKRR